MHTNRKDLAQNWTLNGSVEIVKYSTGLVTIITVDGCWGLQEHVSEM